MRITRDGTQKANFVYHAGTLASSTARVDTSCVKEKQKFIKYTMDVFSILDYVIKKGRPHGHRYVKKSGDKEYYIANKLKKKCKKRCFQGTHERFIRHEQFRSRMIKNGRNEFVCRQRMLLQTIIIPTI